MNTLLCVASLSELNCIHWVRGLSLGTEIYKLLCLSVLRYLNVHIAVCVLSVCIEL